MQVQNEQLKFTAERTLRAHNADMAIVFVLKGGEVYMGHAGMDIATTTKFVDGLREALAPVKPGTILRA